MNFIFEINELKKELDNLKPLTESQQLNLDKKIRLEFNYNSNHIEGNTLTYAETELLLLFDETTGNHTFREYEEMKASDVVYKMIENLANDPDQELTELFIKEINKSLLIKPYWKEAITPSRELTKRRISIGDYKKEPNSVIQENGEIFQYANPLEIPALMGDLISWLRSLESDSKLHPVEIAAELHYKFVCIHPFDDGNGRISRLIMNYVLLKYGFPPVIIKSYDKKRYLKSLHQADTGNLDSFKNYIAEQLLWSLDLFLKAAKNESLEEEEDWKKQLSILKKSLSAQDSVKDVKTIEVLNILINEKLSKFCSSIFENLSDFDELFLSRKVTLINPINGAQNVLNQGKDILEKRLEEQFSNNINILFQFQEFTKTPDNPFTLDLVLHFTLSRHKYDIQFKDTPILTKLYHQDFANEEINVIVNLFGKQLTQLIEDNLQPK
jgi:Fic family protein